MKLTETMRAALTTALATAAERIWEDHGRIAAPGSTRAALVRRGLADRDARSGGTYLSAAGWKTAALMADQGQPVKAGDLVLYYGTCTDWHGEVFVVLGAEDGVHLLGEYLGGEGVLRAVRRTSINPTGAAVPLPEFLEGTSPRIRAASR